jgi:signal transduction histidine kinase
VYGVLVASEWRWVEHAAWVVFEDVVLVMSCTRGVRELREIAVRTVILEEANRDETRQAVELAEVVERLRFSQQQVEAATRAKSEFLANMSHELRTPLNAITLYSELLHENAVEAKREDEAADLTRIRQASKHLLGLINDVLDLSKVEAGKMELHLETFAIKPVLQELAATIEGLVRKNGNQLTVRISDHVGAMHADLTKTRQILFNLLSNAAKFTSNGRVILHVRRLSSVDRESIEFVVEDTGIGLTDEQQTRLFRPFAQGDASIARQYGGTGLGLALVWQFCQMMGGDVHATGAPGAGARFTVKLPARVVDTAGTTAPADPLRNWPSEDEPGYRAGTRFPAIQTEAMARV